MTFCFPERGLSENTIHEGAMTLASSGRVPSLQNCSISWYHGLSSSINSPNSTSNNSFASFFSAFRTRELLSSYELSDLVRSEVRKELAELRMGVITPRRRRRTG
ncbi:hypothetical protein Taro_054533 [Colocasia esculenta]|uniref:Uncharacterized protein n=1 Tax=Colocasia esculenta TaxID=4460 RepID=A0A843XQV9_COLES|nr:hypothetical protein [Colocasia esculenta]